MDTPAVQDPTKRPLNRALRWFFGSLLFFVPNRHRRAYKQVVVRLIYRRSLIRVRRYDGRWICLPREEIDKLFSGDADEKRFNRNNYIPVLRRHVEPGQVVIDVGASYGDEVIDLSDLVGPEGKVYALEPDAAAFAALEETVRLNRLDNVACLHAAVSRETGRISLASRKQAASRSTVSGDDIDAITLDSLWRDRLDGGRVDLVKVDTDGHEIAVIEGADALLKANPGCKILAEYLPRVDYSGRSGAEVLSWYASQGFAVHKIQALAERVEADQFEDLVAGLSDPAEALCHDLLLTRP